jgi:hypothetical protein
MQDLEMTVVVIVVVCNTLEVINLYCNNDFGMVVDDDAICERMYVCLCLFVPKLILTSIQRHTSSLHLLYCHDNDKGEKTD